MKILILNAGSSSLKYQLFDMKDESVLAKGICERITLKDSNLVQKNNKGEEIIIKTDMPDHTVAMQCVIKALLDSKKGVLKSMDEIGAVGHRIVHAGGDFNKSTIVNDKTLKTCEKNIPLAPLHMPGNIACIKSCLAVLKNVPMVMVFDTQFHSTIPQVAHLYGIEYEMATEHKVRRYGFHGTSHQFITTEAMKMFNKKDLKLVICHLGNGSSLSAVKDGKCIDTTMGFTPLEGLMMGTRSGDIDPAAVEYIRNVKGMTSQEVIDYLNKKCGMLGISGYSSDCRDLTAAKDKGDNRAKLALDMVAYRVKKYIGAFTAALGGVDVIIFTGGIGEHSPYIRENVIKDLKYLGIDFDFDLNNNVKRGQVTELTKEQSKTKVYIIPTNEELLIARETKKLVK